MRKSCKGCIHHRYTYSGIKGCCFMLDTGVPRGCPAGDCTRKTTFGYIVKADEYGRDRRVFVDRRSHDIW